MGKRALVMFAICLPFLLGAQVKVPFVGCASDGQVGPLAAPKGKPIVVRIDAEAAKQLAYYKAEKGFGVLAPRSWYCFGTYGSNGESVYVSPKLLTAKDFFSSQWDGFPGPAIQLSMSSGGTSGRFEVARTIARVFPSHRDFVTSVIAEGIEPASDFPNGPYPNDKLTYKSKEMVEYETPAQTKGLGTDSRLRVNASRIRGIAILLFADTDLLQLSLRLPPDLTRLAPAIIHQVEREALKAQSEIE